MKCYGTKVDNRSGRPDCGPRRLGVENPYRARYHAISTISNQVQALKEN